MLVPVRLSISTNFGIGGGCKNTRAHSAPRAKEKGKTYQAIEYGKTLHFQVHTSVFEVQIRRTFPNLMLLMLL